MTTTESLGPQFEGHPHMNKYTDGGMGGVGDDRSVVGLVKTSVLAQMPGNSTNPERVAHYREALRSGEGYKNPAMVMYDPSTRHAMVGEGNHRVRAALEEGHEYVPTRVVRSRVLPDDNSHQGGRPMQLPAKDPGFRGGLGEVYHPSDMHPSIVFPENHLFRDRRS